MLILYSGKERGEKLVIEFELLISIVDKGGLLQTFRDRETGKRGIRKRERERYRHNHTRTFTFMGCSLLYSVN